MVGKLACCRVNWKQKIHCIRSPETSFKLLFKKFSISNTLRIAFTFMHFLLFSSAANVVRQWTLKADLWQFSPLGMYLFYWFLLCVKLHISSRLTPPLGMRWLRALWWVTVSLMNNKCTNYKCSSVKFCWDPILHLLQMALNSRQRTWHGVQKTICSCCWAPRGLTVCSERAVKDALPCRTATSPVLTPDTTSLSSHSLTR